MNNTTLIEQWHLQMLRCSMQLCTAPQCRPIHIRCNLRYNSHFQQCTHISTRSLCKDGLCPAPADTTKEQYEDSSAATQCSSTRMHECPHLQLYMHRSKNATTLQQSSSSKHNQVAQRSSNYAMTELYSGQNKISFVANGLTWQQCLVTELSSAKRTRHER